MTQVWVEANGTTGSLLRQGNFRSYHLGNVIPFFHIMWVQLTSWALASNSTLGLPKTPLVQELDKKTCSKGSLCITADPKVIGPGLGLSWEFSSYKEKGWACPHRVTPPDLGSPIFLHSWSVPYWLNYFLLSDTNQEIFVGHLFGTQYYG